MRGLPDGVTIDDAYEACDVVTFPSTWEGFGNPTIESAVHRKPLVVGHYPVLDELRAFGFQWYDADNVELDDYAALDHNYDIADAHFDLRDLPRRLAPHRAGRLTAWTIRDDDLDPAPARARRCDSPTPASASATSCCSSRWSCSSSDWSSGSTASLPTTVVVCMAVAAVILAPSIILGYAAKAAERRTTGQTGTDPVSLAFTDG